MCNYLYAYFSNSMAESEVVYSTIRPTYRLSYDSAAELLVMHVEEEAELYFLAEVGKLDEWRTAQLLTLLDKLEGHLNWWRLNAGCTYSSYWASLCQREGV